MARRSSSFFLILIFTLFSFVGGQTAFAQSEALGSVDVSGAATEAEASAQTGVVANTAAAVPLNAGSKANWVHNHPLAIILLGMAVLAAVQALSDHNVAGQDAAVAATASCTGTSCTTDASGTGSGTTSTAGSRAGTGPLALQADQAAATAAQIVGDAAANGVTYNPATGGVTTPMGSVSAAQMGSEAGLESAGLSSSAAKVASDALAAANKLADDKMRALRGTSFGSEVSDPQQRAIAQASGTNFDFLKAAMKPKKSVKPSLAGLSRATASGDQIGVAGDNIFSMINRRYSAQRAQGKFLTH